MSKKTMGGRSRDAAPGVGRRTALITGGSRGIGAAIALRLARDGFDILLNYRADHAAAAKVKAQAESRGASCALVPFDVTDERACAAALEPAVRQNVPFVVVSNAGFARDTLMAVMEPGQWHDVLAVHLDGFYNVISCVLPSMMRKREGRIITVASTAGQVGSAGQVNYSAAKAGLIGATRSLAVEVAPRGILVNAVAPGYIETEMLAGLVTESLVLSIPLKRTGKTDEVAGAVSFLASPDASYITGQVIGVNGGLFTG